MYLIMKYLLLPFKYFRIIYFEIFSKTEKYAKTEQLLYPSHIDYPTFNISHMLHLSSFHLNIDILLQTV